MERNMNPSQEQDQTASNVFIEGELSEEDLIEIAGAAADAQVNISLLGNTVGSGVHV